MGLRWTPGESGGAALRGAALGGRASSSWVDVPARVALGDGGNRHRIAAMTANVAALISSANTAPPPATSNPPIAGPTT